MDLELGGKTVLITGASKGIGLACAKLLAKEGCRLVLVARGKSGLNDAKRMLESNYGAEVSVYAADLGDSRQIQSLVASCTHADMLVNNAGAIPGGDLWQVDEKSWREAWDLKVFGYINMCREFYSAMKQNGNGVILNIIGAGGERPDFGYIAGGSANAGLMAFTKALGAESIKDGVRVIGVNPGQIRTERLESFFKSIARDRLGNEMRWQELLPKDPEPGQPEDIANLVAFLLSPKAGNITGTIVTSDGGYSAK